MARAGIAGSHFPPPRDLAAALQDQVADLDRRLDAYLMSIGAALPKPNPAFGK